MRALTQDDLEQAFARARRPDWPATLEATLAGPHAAALRLAAWRLTQGQDIDAVPVTVRRPQVVAPVPPLMHRDMPDRQQPLFDRKRAASGDRDD